MPYLHWIIDLVIVAILLVSYLRGRKKGLILTLCGLAAFFVALFGARFFSQQLTPMAADALTPHFSSMVEQNTDLDLSNQLDQLLVDPEGESLLLDSLKAVGLYDSFADSVRDLLSQQAAGAMTNAATALAHAIAEVVASVVIFIVAFLLILLVWFLLSRLLNLAARLPLIRGLNRLLGGVIGLAQGALLLFFAAWILRLCGGVIPADVVETTTVLKFFMTANPISIFSGI
jgi:uncharacterized membrane protein required for colicin V production